MKEERNWLEWIVLGLATPLVVFVFAYLLYQAVSSGGPGDELPVLKVVPGKVTASADNHFQVQVAVQNTGPVTAEHLQVEVELVGAPEKEAVEFDISRLASEARFEVYVLFTQDPRVAGRSVRGKVKQFRLP